MNKTKTNIFAVLIGILLGSIYLLAMPGALAQDTSGAQIQIEVESGCSWDGTPYASNLRVYDNEICVLTGIHNVGAYNVQVDEDDGISPTQLGGWLIVGSDSIDTDITFGGTMTMNGILEIGVSGNPDTNSNLQIDGTSVISATGSDGNLTILYNSDTSSTCGPSNTDPCGNNTIELSSSLTIASASTGGSLTNNDDAITSTISSISIYGPILSNHGVLENLAGTITVTNQIDMYGYGEIDNDGVLTLGNVASYWNNYASADNSGTFNSPNTINLYSSSHLTNSGTWNGGTLYFGSSGTSLNDSGTMNLGTLNCLGSGTFNNTGTGDINVTNNLVLNSGGTINNNDTGTVTVDLGTYVYNAASNINNNSSWETDLLQIGILPTVAGGNFNNFGTLTFPAPSATSINIYNGGDLNNETTGTITVPTNIYMEGASGQISTITNDNVTDTDAIGITGTITMDDYAAINNSGNLTVNGASNIIFGADNGTAETINSTITNNASGYIDLNGATEAIFDEDISVTNAGIIDVAPTATFNDTASFDQTAGDFNAPNLALTDTTSAEANFTMSGGTVDLTSYLYVYDGGTVNNNVVNINGGTLTAATLNLGFANNTTGVIINNGGIINIDGTGRLSTTGGTDNHITKGILDIKATSTNSPPVNMLSSLYIRGDASESSYMYMANPNTASLHDVYLYEYGNYYANDGYTNLQTYTFYVHGNASSQGLLYIADGAEVLGMYGVYMGTSSVRGGKIENYGILRRGVSSNLQLYMYNSAYIYNGSTGNIDTVGGMIYMFPNENQPVYGSYSYIENVAGGIIDTYGLYTNNTGHVIDNYGSFILTLGYLGNANGGTFNNYNIFTLSGGALYVYYAAEFYNHPDATASGTGSIIIDGASAKYYQTEGTDGATPAVKTSLNSITVTNGLFENADYVNARFLTVNTNGTYNGVLANTFSGAPVNDAAQDSITLINSLGDGDVSVTGDLTIDGGVSDEATLRVADNFTINSTGVVTIDGTLEMQIPIANTLNNYGQLYSGDYSAITLVDNPGMNAFTGSFTQFAGTLTATSINMNGGDMCIGSYSGTYPTGTCSNNALDPTKTITNSGTAFDVGGDANVDMYNDLTLTNGDLNVNEASVFETWTTSPLLDVQNNANIIIIGSGSSFYAEGTVQVQGSGTGNHGYLKVDSRGGAELAGTASANNIGSFWIDANATGETGITIDAGVTVNLNDTHNAGGTVGVITAGIDDEPGSETITVGGTLNMNSGGVQNIYLGADTTTNWNVDGMIIYPGASFQHTNGSTGDLDINRTAIFYVGDDGTSAVDADINGAITVGGNYGNDQNGPHGAYIDGQVECYDYPSPTTAGLIIEDDGLLDISSTGTVTVNGSATDVYGLVELDGTLNSGDLTVYSGGIISSGDGASPLSAPVWPTYEGCGPNGVFGCGTSTNFYINADSLDVQSGGKISSDGTSKDDTNTSITTAHGGSYAGEGINSGGAPGATYGTTKASTPVYGERGEIGTDGIIASHGGGGVNIYVAGDITIDGDVSANGGSLLYTLQYSSASGDFVVGDELTGGSSGATALIVDDVDPDIDGNGYVVITNISNGPFSATETITDQHTDSATVVSPEAITNAAGSGGTVIITQDLSAAPTTAIFTGIGTISANGGDATYPGGGGRVVIDSILLDNPDFGSYDFGEATAGTVEALGGTDGASAYAAAGTMVYLGDVHNADDTLIIEQGSNAPTSSTQTDLADTPTFDRIEVGDNANADLTGATTQVCYDGTGSSITGLTCSNFYFPDKPDTLYINTTSIGAQSGSEPGYIAGKGNGVSDTPLDVQDITPVFSVVYRHPETIDASKMQIQVDDNETFASPLWDYTKTGITDSGSGALSDNERSIDVEYNEDSLGTALSVITPYFVRVRFLDASDNPGLWTHADYNDQYKFAVSSYTDLWVDNCNGVPANTSLVITQSGTTGGADMSNTSGQRYSYGSCDVHISTSESNWEVYGSYATGESDFRSVTNIFNNINNAGSDCNIDSGGTASQEEFGYNITTYPLGTSAEQIVDANVNVDPECSTACTVDSYTGKYNQSQDVNNAKNCYFDIEALASPDTILDTTTGTASGLDDGIFTVNVHAHAYQTDAGEYDTVLEYTITPTP